MARPNVAPAQTRPTIRQELHIAPISNLHWLGERCRRLGALPGEANLEKLAGLVASGKLDPYSAADELING